MKMEKVWLVKMIATDEATYSIEETIAICTDEMKAIELEEKAKETLIYLGISI